MASGAKDGTVLIEIGYVKAGIDDLKRDNKEISTKVNSLTERITRCEESNKQAHLRIDRINHTTDVPVEAENRH